ncbi:hypothetical protein [Klebsiella aerogenes]|uniref:hypothetical protein n=1 Tax=Klebsiella aerogenes TaxID=548 RepID=UPI0019058893|nr:hypothetical protein [Klebsiella aerogenes]MBK0469641.1 hypothetical protein [Klebsiella aerogenes]
MKKIIILILIVTLVSAFIVFDILRSKQNEELFCTSTLTRTSLGGPTKSYTVGTVLDFTSSSMGKFSFYGDSKDVDKKYHVQRNYKFTYKKLADGTITIEIKNLWKHPLDNLSDIDFNKYIFDLKTGEQRNISLYRKNNLFLIFGDSPAPLYACTVKD